MGFWIGGEASQPLGGIGPTGHLTCQEQSRKMPGLVNNKSNMLLRLYPTLSFSLILLLITKCGIPRAGIRLCRNRRGILWRDVDYVAGASRPFGRDPVKLGFVPKNAYGSLGRRLLPDKSFRRISRELNARILIGPRNGGLVNRIGTVKRSVPER